MSTTYEQTTTTTTASSGQPVGVINLNVGFIKTIPGILKIVEMVLDLIVIICVSILPWSVYGGGWVYFVSVTAIITTLFIFLFCLFGIYHKFSYVWHIVVLIYYIVFTVFYLIAGIVAATRGWIHSSIGAAAFFCFAAMVAYGIDTYFQFQNFRIERSGSSSTTTTTGGTTTVTTSSTTYEQRPQY